MTTDDERCEVCKGAKVLVDDFGNEHTCPWCGGTGKTTGGEDGRH